jgi:hypothetical protein
MKKLGKIHVICFAFFLLTLCVRAEGNAHFTHNDLLKNDSEKTALFFSQEKTEIETPGETSHILSCGSGNLPVFHIKKSQKEISLAFLEPKTKKIKSKGITLPYLLTIIPTITVSDIIFPSHYFL